VLCLLLAWSVPSHPQSAAEDIDRAEQLSWMDAPAAVQLLDKLRPTMQSGDALVQWLMVRGLAYADGEEEQARAVVKRLHELGGAQASAASHIVQGYLFLHAEQLDRAEAELKFIGADAALPAFERYRLEVLRGAVQLFFGRHEVALSAYERALDLAHAMHSESRAIEVTIKLTDLYVATGESDTHGNLDRAAGLVWQLRSAAQQSGDEILWVEVLTFEAEIADIRGDPAAQRRALLDALAHAKRAGSDRSMALVLDDLSYLHLKTGDYAAALGYSRQMFQLARKLRRTLFEWAARFTMGLAQIGMGHLAQGKRLANGAIQQALASGNLSDADHLMRDFAPALERAGDLRGALKVGHREEKVREQLMTAAREKALLELSAKFDDERRVRQIELLQRDNAVKSRDLQAQRLRQQMIVMAAALIAVACGAFAWGIGRIRKVNARLLHNSRHDALTGLLNRRYFNEQILAQLGKRPYLGCLLLVDIDHLQRINDTLGHAAGDELLSAISKRLADTLRDSDALVRWAGEQFLVLMGPMSDAQLTHAARRLLSAIRSEPVIWQGQSLQCTVSVGYASFPLTGAAIDVTFDRAITLVDKAQYQAKRRGRDRACLIVLVNAGTEQELSAINARFEEAVADRRVQLAETVCAAD
jgi:diguanylate cyclase (GGDEF)-like protein